jgi:hypothetical protein
LNWLLNILKPDGRMIGAGLCAIGALHVFLVFAMQVMTPTLAPERLTAGVNLHEMVLLPPVKPGTERLPFQSPGARYAVCRFDTGKTDVAIRALLPEPGWFLALYSNEGENFYVAVGQPGRKISVALQLVPNDGRFTGLTPQAKGMDALNESALKVPAKDGIVVLAAPDRGYAYRDRMLADMKLSSCRAEKS